MHITKRMGMVGYCTNGFLGGIREVGIIIHGTSVRDGRSWHSRRARLAAATRIWNHTTVPSPA